MGELAVGAIVGVFTSLVGWWLIERAFVPNLHVCRRIGVLPERRRAHTWRYRIKVVNVRRWPLKRRAVIDVRVVVTLQILGLDEDAPYNWTNYVVPLPNNGVSALLMTNSVVELRMFDVKVDHDQRPLLASHVDAEDPDRLDLRRLLALGRDAKLRVLVTASDSYTHATTTRVVYFRAEDFADGRFSRKAGRAGLKIVAPRAAIAEQEPPRGDELAPGGAESFESPPDAGETEAEAEPV